ncbi:MAG: hypothetical protein FWH22_10195, partial [Fibromonadales bacterium]|nr:hypothetical protein [Fibromonadales bacterium]
MNVKNKILSAMTVVIAMVSMAWAQTGTPDYSWYTGPNQSTYEIANADQLRGFANIFNNTATAAGIARYGFANATIKLTADIDLSDYNPWLPIGNGGDISVTADRYFAGVFDGNGKTITNLNINNTSSNAALNMAGLFRNINGGEVKNLAVVNAVVSSTQENAGVIAAVVQNGGKITNCYVLGGTITGTSRVGGIASAIATSGGIISNCWATNAVSGTSYVGGIVGNTPNATNATISPVLVENCAALNVSITRRSGTDTNFGRVTGTTAGTRANNTAFAEMQAIEFTFAG